MDAARRTPTRVARPFDAAVVILADITRRLPQAHTFAWWPGGGAPQHSRAGSNKTRGYGLLAADLRERADGPVMTDTLFQPFKEVLQ